jgi:hypothetical protein
LEIANLVLDQLHSIEHSIFNLHSKNRKIFQSWHKFWVIIGYNPDQTDSEGSTTRLPSISSWFSSDTVHSPRKRPTAAAAQSRDSENSIDSDYENNVDEDEAQDEIISEERDISFVIDSLEKIKLASFDEEDKVNNLVYASVSLSVNDSMEM